METVQVIPLIFPVDKLPRVKDCIMYVYLAFIAKLFFIIIIIRPHCSTTYVDAACCYGCSVVCRSVCHNHEPCKNG